MKLGLESYLKVGFATLIVGFCTWFAYDLHQELATLRATLRALVAEQGSSVAPPEVIIEKQVAPSNPHADVISALETQSGLKLSRVAKLIIRDEGDRSRPYLDRTGAVTIGVGRNLKGNGLSVAELHAISGELDYRLLLSKTRVHNGRVYIDSLSLAKQVFVKPLTEADIQLLLMDDLKNVIREAQKVFPNWGQLTPVRKEVVVDMLFNLGLTRFKTFENFIGAVKVKDFKTAGDELLKSLAARENPDRYFRLYHVMVTGDEQYFEL